MIAELSRFLFYKTGYNGVQHNNEPVTPKLLNARYIAKQLM